jgi:hypothetical protein
LRLVPAPFLRIKIRGLRGGIKIQLDSEVWAGEDVPRFILIRACIQQSFLAGLRALEAMYGFVWLLLPFRVCGAFA